MAAFRYRFEHRQHIANIGDFLVVEKDVGVIQFDILVLRIIDEVGREVAAVKLHAFHNFQRIFQPLTFFYGDHAFFAHFFHRFGDFRAHGFVRVGRDGADLGDFLVGVARLGHGLQGFDRFNHGFINAAFQIHRVHARGNGFQAFGNNRLGENGSGGGAIAGGVVGLRSDFFHQLRAHILELVFQLDFLGDGNAVFGHGRGAKRLVQHHIAAFGTQSDFHGIGEYIHAFQHFLAGVCAKTDFFSCHNDLTPKNKKLIKR